VVRSILQTGAHSTFNRGEIVRFIINVRVYKVTSFFKNDSAEVAQYVISNVSSN